MNAGVVRVAANGRSRAQAGALSAVLLFAVQSSIVHAAEANSIGLGLSYLSFRYAEFPDNERLRNKETGLLPGLNASLKFTPGSWRIGVAGSFHGGEVDYDGATSSFRPHRTQTDTQIFNGTASLGYAFNSANPVTLTPYLGGGYRYWRRDILPNNGVSGLLENYRWFYGVLGLEVGWQKSERFSIGADLRFIRPINPKLDVKIARETTLDLGPRTGVRFGVPMNWSLRGNFGIALEPYYERQALDASPAKNGILEPASETDIFGVHLSGRLRF
jgi:Autotransporter beta-domain